MEGLLMTLKLGIIGLSPGNGHPYSWAAICNGYDKTYMSQCSFPAIPDYLALQKWPDDQLAGANVTHIWTQNTELSHHISRSALIDTVVERPEDMIGQIDALLLARDDAENHLRFAEPFLRAGVPIYIDKPIALSRSKLDELLALQQWDGQIFSCSALRFAPELQVDKVTSEKIGPIRLIQGTTPKYWETYAIHIIDPIINLLGYAEQPKQTFRSKIGPDGRILGLRWPSNGPDVHLMATGSTPAPLQIRIFGEVGELTLTFKDSFTAFKRALSEFAHGVKEGKSRLPDEFNKRAVEIIEMGLL